MDYCDGLSVAVDMCIRRALERIGRKLNTKKRGTRDNYMTEQEAIDFHTKRPVDSCMIDNRKLFGGSWEFIPVIARRYDLDEYELTQALDSYCRNLLVTGTRHDFSNTCYILDQISRKDVGSQSASIGGQ